MSYIVRSLYSLENSTYIGILDSRSCEHQHITFALYHKEGSESIVFLCSFLKKNKYFFGLRVQICSYISIYLNLLNNFKKMSVGLSVYAKHLYEHAKLQNHRACVDDFLKSDSGEVRVSHILRTFNCYHLPFRRYSARV